MNRPPLHDHASVPTLVEVWAPTCSACKAMEPDMREVSARYAGTVRFERIDAAADPHAVAGLGVLGTPTLIGYVDGDEVYRATGRRTRPELEAVFDDLAAGAAPRSGPSRSDLVLRFGAGAVLIAVGALVTGAWPLMAVGGAVILATLVPLIGRYRADRP